MLSALLPGVREFRTPLVTGALWAACAWFMFGNKATDSDDLRDFATRFRLGEIPPTMAIAAACFLMYLVGSLLVVRRPPMADLRRELASAIHSAVRRLDLNVLPKRMRFRPAWWLWQRFARSRLLWPIRAIGSNPPGWEAVDGWLHNYFSVLSAEGRVPVMRSFEGGCGALKGFLAFCSTESVDQAPPGYFGEDGVRFRLSQVFVDEIKSEKAAVEVRIQMRYPEVYSEIDRLKVEAELRLSIFWPLILLSLIVAWTLSPISLVMLVIPPLLARDAAQRLSQADDKTWSALVAGEVSSPSLDAMAGAMDSPCLNFIERFGPRDGRVAEGEPADLRLA